ncbi:MAG: hypothetical protein RJA25_1685 [Bacteroidota bacterium]|jgi:hypothetical protein
MKLFNYSTWSLFFTTIMQAVSGHTCPNITEVNSKIDAKQPMRFPLLEGERPFWHYKDDNNQNKKFYNDSAKATEILGSMYYQAHLNEDNSALRCIYKNSKSTYFSLAATNKRVNEINSSSITEDKKNWNGIYNSGLYACGDEQPKESLDRCQFSLKVSR